MIAFKDFVPAQIESRSLFRRVEFEPLDAIVETANAWIAEHSVHVINVETVLMPNLGFPKKDTSTGHYRTSGHNLATNTWHQVLRVWYEV
jgi:hypothetical protein